ncbi:MAG: hypothetical protein JST61_08930 [Acidobacteria bacterium]|nr:hypothetical protein [Acidobacteriota bacterium]
MPVASIKQRYVAVTIALCLAAAHHGRAQQAAEPDNHAGRVPVISGGFGYVHNVSGGATSLIPQINPVLLVPFGQHVLLESRTDFTGFFERQNQTSGPFKGKVFKTVEFAQLDWFANSHIMAAAGRYLLPFGIYNERFQPIWIKNLQDAPITATIGTRTSGSGDGLMLRGVATQRPQYSLQYTAYFSAHSKINQLQAARVAGADASIYLPQARLELGTSYQRFLEGHRINSVATYASWQPSSQPFDLKAEYDHSHNGHGYWLETAYSFRQLSAPHFFQRIQTVARIQQFFASNGGGNGLPSIDTQRFDFGLNYYIRDDLRFISSYGRSFSSHTDSNIWNIGFTYRFLFPLWPEKRQ